MPPHLEGSVPIAASAASPASPASLPRPAPRPSMVSTAAPDRALDALDPRPNSAPGARQPLVWSNIVMLGIMHAIAGVCVGLGVFTLRMWIFGYAYSFLGALGVTAGVHRLWSHRAYKARRPLRYLLAVFFSAAGQNTILDWVRDHRVHHKFTETDADPHNAKRGFFFAHVGWLMQRKHPDVYRQGAKVDLSDVESDPVVQWHTRNFWLLKFIFALAVPTLIPVLVWGDPWHLAILAGLLRLVLTLNFTWAVNSAAHLYGTHPYDNRINPTENALVSALSFGEGWHNYHHIFPWDYKAAELRYLNATALFLDQCARFGWAYDLKTASPDLVARVALRHGDGSHPKHGVEHAAEEHFQEVPYEEYLRIVKDDGELTGVRDLHNAKDPTRQRVA